MIKCMGNNLALRNPMKQCIYESFSTRKRAARPMMFELLGWGFLLSTKHVAARNNSGQRENRSLLGKYTC